MSIGSRFQNCKQDNVSNLMKRGRRTEQQLDYEKKPVR